VFGEGSSQLSTQGVPEFHYAHNAGSPWAPLSTCDTTKAAAFGKNAVGLTSRDRGVSRNDPQPVDW
jgi:hypothetical protein